MKLYKSLSVAIREREKVTALKLTLTNDFPDLSLFPNLQDLYLDGELETLPDDIYYSPITLLSIRFVNLKNDLSRFFSFPKLTNLKIIDTPMKTFKMPMGYSTAPLKFLTIKDCGLEVLPKEIEMLEHLTELNLSGNQLSALPDSFVNLERLKRLNLDQNKFSLFPDQIKRMQNLSHLSIDSNKFPDEELDRIQRHFHITPH